MYAQKFLLSTLFIYTLFNLPSVAQPQDSLPQVSLTPESGFYVESADHFMGFRISTRLQEQAGFYAPLRDQASPSSEVLIRRARIRVHGYFYENKLTYFVQLQMDKGNFLLSNAEFRWNPIDHLKLSFGQLWPAGARQFRTVSQNFQMIDRSTVTRYLAPGYDLGVNGQYDLNVTPQFILKTYASITHGEGMNKPTDPGGYAYAGRVELLPFGDFAKHGDYSESDLYREPTPKLSMGASVHYNQDANLFLGGQTQYQDWENQPNDITTYSLDLLYKHAGFSLLAEFMKRELQQSVIPNSVIYSHLSGGKGFYIQTGKFLTKTIEPTFRFSFLDPNDTLQNLKSSFLRRDTYTLGLNNFLRGHAIKLQLEVNLIDELLSTSNDHDLYLQVLTQFSISF